MALGGGADDQLRRFAVGADEAEQGRHPMRAEAVTALAPFVLQPLPGRPGECDGRDGREPGLGGFVEPQGLAGEQGALDGRQAGFALGRCDRKHFQGQGHKDSPKLSRILPVDLRTRNT